MNWEIPPHEYPLFQNYQLIGDSQLVRFSEQFLNCRRQYHQNSSGRVGYCMGGQNAQQLSAHLKKKTWPLYKNVVVLIGTNDICKSTDPIQWKATINSIINSFSCHGVENVIILSVPPVPKLCHTVQHWADFIEYNEVLKDTETKFQDQFQSIKFLDITSLFFDSTDSRAFSSPKSYDLIVANPVKEGLSHYDADFMMSGHPRQSSLNTKKKDTTYLKQGISLFDVMNMKYKLMTACPGRSNDKDPSINKDRFDLIGITLNDVVNIKSNLISIYNEEYMFTLRHAFQKFMAHVRGETKRGSDYFTPGKVLRTDLIVYASDDLETSCDQRRSSETNDNVTAATTSKVKPDEQSKQSPDCFVTNRISTEKYLDFSENPFTEMKKTHNVPGNAQVHAEKYPASFGNVPVKTENVHTGNRNSGSGREISSTEHSPDDTPKLLFGEKISFKMKKEVPLKPTSGPIRETSNYVWQRSSLEDERGNDSFNEGNPLFPGKSCQVSSPGLSVRNDGSKHGTRRVSNLIPTKVVLKQRACEQINPGTGSSRNDKFDFSQKKRETKSVENEENVRYTEDTTREVRSRTSASVLREGNSLPLATNKLRRSERSFRDVLGSIQKTLTICKLENEKNKEAGGCKPCKTSDGGSNQRKTDDKEGCECKIKEIKNHDKRDVGRKKYSNRSGTQSKREKSTAEKHSGTASEGRLKDEVQSPRNLSDEPNTAMGRRRNRKNSQSSCDKGSPGGSLTEKKVNLNSDHKEMKKVAQKIQNRIFSAENDFVKPVRSFEKMNNANIVTKSNVLKYVENLYERSAVKGNDRSYLNNITTGEGLFNLDPPHHHSIAPINLLEGSSNLLIMSNGTSQWNYENTRNYTTPIEHFTTPINQAQENIHCGSQQEVVTFMPSLLNCPVSIHEGFWSSNLGPLQNCSERVSHFEKKSLATDGLMPSDRGPLSFNEGDLLSSARSHPTTATSIATLGKSLGVAVEPVPLDSRRVNYIANDLCPTSTLRASKSHLNTMQSYCNQEIKDLENLDMHSVENNARMSFSQMSHLSIPRSNFHLHDSRDPSYPNANLIRNNKTETNMTYNDRTPLDILGSSRITNLNDEDSFPSELDVSDNRSIVQRRLLNDYVNISLNDSILNLHIGERPDSNFVNNDLSSQHSNRMNFAPNAPKMNLTDSIGILNSTPCQYPMENQTSLQDIPSHSSSMSNHYQDLLGVPSVESSIDMVHSNHVDHEPILHSNETYRISTLCEPIERQVMVFHVPSPMTQPRDSLPSMMTPFSLHNQKQFNPLPDLIGDLHFDNNSFLTDSECVCVLCEGKTDSPLEIKNYHHSSEASKVSTTEGTSDIIAPGLESYHPQNPHRAECSNSELLFQDIFPCGNRPDNPDELLESTTNRAKAQPTEDEHHLQSGSTHNSYLFPMTSLVNFKIPYRVENRVAISPMATFNGTNSANATISKTRDSLSTLQSPLPHTTNNMQSSYSVADAPIMPKEENPNPLTFSNKWRPRVMPEDEKPTPQGLSSWDSLVPQKDAKYIATSKKRVFREEDNDVVPQRKITRENHMRLEVDYSDLRGAIFAASQKKRERSSFLEEHGKRSAEKVTTLNKSSSLERANISFNNSSEEADVFNIEFLTPEEERDQMHRRARREKSDQSYNKKYKQRKRRAEGRNTEGDRILNRYDKNFCMRAETVQLYQFIQRVCKYPMNHNTTLLREKTFDMHLRNMRSEKASDLENKFHSSMLSNYEFYKFIKYVGYDLIVPKMFPIRYKKFMLTSIVDKNSKVNQFTVHRLDVSVFETHYSRYPQKMPKVDLIHLNLKGFKLLKDTLSKAIAEIEKYDNAP